MQKELWGEYCTFHKEVKSKDGSKLACENGGLKGLIQEFWDFD